MFNDTAVLPQKSPASVARYNALGEVPQGRPMQHTCIEIAEFQAAPLHSALLTVRRQLSDYAVSDCVITTDIQHSLHEIHSYWMSNKVVVAVIRPVSAPSQQPQCWWEPWRRRSDAGQTWCQQIAHTQLRNSRHFIVCQPHQFDTTWSFILRYDRVISSHYDRCICLLQDAGRQNDNPPRYERMYLIASCPGLLWPFRNCICKKIHAHSNDTDSPPSCWSLDEAQRMSEGIRYTLESERVGHSIISAFPF